MGWNYRYPVQMEDETDEEYQERCEAYERAESDYEDRCVENYFDRKYS